MKTLKISNRAWKGNIDCFSNLLDIYKFEPDNYNVIDMSSFIEVNPFNVLTIAIALKQKENGWGQIKLAPSHEYLQYLGFYKFCGIKNINKTRQVKPGAYICIREIEIKPHGSIEADYEKLEDEAKILASMLNFDKNLMAYGKYCFFEMIRNVYEHSQSKKFYVCAQYWPTHHLVEIAIADEGCGIKEAMSKRFSEKNEEERLLYALKPGITALTNISYITNNYYSNTGYGLYVTKELSLAYEGSFIICSGNYGHRYTKENKIESFKTKFKGTAIASRFKTDTYNDFKTVIQTIVQKGEKEAANIRGAIKKASKSSGGMQWF